jgi:hypothetical protein
LYKPRIFTPKTKVIMKKYSFNSVKEPTEKQLKTLMLAVLEDVKERAAIADEKFKAQRVLLHEQILQTWKLNQENNGKK